MSNWYHQEELTSETVSIYDSLTKEPYYDKIINSHINRLSQTIDPQTNKVYSGVLFNAVIKSNYTLLDSLLQNSSKLVIDELYYGFLYKALYLTHLSRKLEKLRADNNISTQDLIRWTDIGGNLIVDLDRSLIILFKYITADTYNPVMFELLSLSQQEDDQVFPEILVKFLRPNVPLKTTILNDLVELNIVSGSVANIKILMQYEDQDYISNYLFALERKNFDISNLFRPEIDVVQLFDDLLEDEDDEGLDILLTDNFDLEDLFSMIISAIEHDKIELVYYLLNKTHEFISNNSTGYEGMIAGRAQYQKILNDVLLIAVDANKPDIVYNLLRWKANNYDAAIIQAQSKNLSQIENIIDEFRLKQLTTATAA